MVSCQALFSHLRYVEQLLDKANRFSIANCKQLSLDLRLLCHVLILQLRLRYGKSNPTLTVAQPQQHPEFKHAIWDLKPIVLGEVDVTKGRGGQITYKSMAIARIDWCSTIVRFLARYCPQWPNADLPLWKPFLGDRLFRQNPSL